jgi:lipid II:glycine glycyltransferase (peptidoglycan interpeptide bridge formation enzyme)
VEHKNKNIYVDLHEFENEEEILKSYKHNNRKSIKKSKESNVSVIIDDTGKYFNEFYKIYKHTMIRNDASAYYYLSEDYFYSIHQLKGNFIYFHSVYESTIISTELLLYDNNCIYSFLGGTLSDYFNVCPNNLLKHQIILWAMDKKIKYFMLGGGYNIDDGIYKYKKSFAPSNEIDFFIGKKIYNKQIYDKLCEIRKEQSEIINEQFFPIYRS